MAKEQFQESLDKWDTMAIALMHSPSLLGIISSFGYVGHLLLSGKKITKQRIVGGVMLSIFTGTCAYFLASALGFPDKLCTPIALLAGSLCESGYVALTERAMQILGSKE